MFKYYFFAFNATLSDYMTMVDFLAKKDVDIVLQLRQAGESNG